MKKELNFNEENHNAIEEMAINTKEEASMRFKDVTEMQVELLSEARRIMVSSLAKRKEGNPGLESLEIREWGGRGIENALNNRRMYMWIACLYKGKEYKINFFHSEIDAMSGNCHCQIGKVMFTKDFVQNKQGPLSPNVIFRNEDDQENSEFLTDRDSTVFVFNSYKWHSPLEYFKDAAPDKLANGKWVTVDDILDGGLADEIADAFFEFIMKDRSKVPASYWEYAALNGFGYEIYDIEAAKYYNRLASKLNELDNMESEDTQNLLESLLENEIYPLGAEYGFLGDILDEFLIF